MPFTSSLAIRRRASGSIAVLPINADGSLATRSDLVELKGPLGPDPKEQAGSHPHHNPFDRQGRFILVPDKGLDRVFVFRLDASAGKLVPADPPYVATRPGAGPRHVDFHPTLPYAYVINELDSTVAAYRFDQSGALDPLQILPSIPATFTGENTGPAIDVAPSGVNHSSAR